MPFRPLILAALLLPTVALAQSDHAGHAGQGASSPDMAGAMGSMTQDMASVPMTGDPDRDFVQMMIPHHEGAIAMAKAVLDHGKDTEIRKLAEAVIAAQESEVAWMKDWLARHPE